MKVRYCAVMYDTNMLTASYSLMIITHDVELAFVLEVLPKCYLKDKDYFCILKWGCTNCKIVFSL